MFYADAVLAPGAAIPMPDEHEDRGAYVIEGSVEVAGQVHEAGRMMVFRPGDRVSLKAGPQGARLMLLGGETLDGPRWIWWNFVASSKFFFLRIFSTFWQMPRSSSTTMIRAKVFLLSP